MQYDLTNDAYITHVLDAAYAHDRLSLTIIELQKMIGEIRMKRILKDFKDKLHKMEQIRYEEMNRVIVNIEDFRFCESIGGGYTYEYIIK